MCVANCHVYIWPVPSVIWPACIRRMCTTHCDLGQTCFVLNLSYAGMHVTKCTGKARFIISTRSFRVTSFDNVYIISISYSSIVLCVLQLVQYLHLEKNVLTKKTMTTQRRTQRRLGNLVTHWVIPNASAEFLSFFDVETLF